MSPRLSTQPIIPRSDLEKIGDERLREAEALLEAGCFAGAAYLGGYSVECYLKAAICHRLRQDQLFKAFKTHDLDGLLLCAELAADLKDDTHVYKSFRQIVGLWNDKNGEVAVRYRDPADINQATARTFFDWLLGVPEGLIPWLRRAIS